MRLELGEFAKAARSMHQQTGGIKRTRLMLRLRPYKARKTFVLKATDGRTTLTTRVEHQGQIKLVEALLSDFVSACTCLSVPTAGAQSQSSLPAGAANTAPASNPPAPGKEGAAAGKAGPANSGAAGGHPSSAPHQQHQPQRSNNKQSNKAKKGKRH
ncbi:hypothetical protein ABL78_8167 [Leptomonas seymouri]|uniref:SRP9 domain-containing protein n=1 Tax=Leptomonas seymouri TaxID=5684 RepID=A0A0N1HT10_LEPSE|nr:hypothetical protein ABL78_8167 [Leptomonas seymouri]|eukprot:KPI82818.1 hypothetical protein ABL78_8167 [Leptomonas seymouri]